MRAELLANNSTSNIIGIRIYIAGFAMFALQPSSAPKVFPSDGSRDSSRQPGQGKGKARVKMLRICSAWQPVVQSAMQPQNESQPSTRGTGDAQAVVQPVSLCCAISPYELRAAELKLREALLKPRSVQDSIAKEELAESEVDAEALLKRLEGKGGKEEYGGG